MMAYTAATALSELRRLLTLLSCPSASSFGLKAFRMGRATALAREGKPLHVILQSGEWKSAAALSYADEDDLDFGGVLAAAYTHSDEEDE